MVRMPRAVHSVSPTLHVQGSLTIIREKVYTSALSTNTHSLGPTRSFPTVVKRQPTLGLFPQVSHYTKSHQDIFVVYTYMQRSKHFCHLTEIEVSFIYPKSCVFVLNSYILVAQYRHQLDLDSYISVSISSGNFLPAYQHHRHPNARTNPTKIFFFSVK